MSDPYAPRPEHRFTFGLWTVGNPGRDPFGEEVRSRLDPVEIVHLLAELGAYGVNFHDNDLIPFGASASERDLILKRFRTALDETGMKVPMVTANLAFHAAFKEGAYTANDPAVRRFALQKTFECIDVGAELGATTYVMWGGRNGTESYAAKDARAALDRYKEAIDAICAYIRETKVGMRVAIEPKPNEPRGDLLLPTVGHALAFIERLEWRDMVGLNPEFAHEKMSGLAFHHAIAQALWHGKLFHVDLNSQQPGKYDQDFRFGATELVDTFWTVKLLEDAAWDGMRHFDAHAYRTEDVEGVWDFARGCMRTYLMLAEKARRFDEDEQIQSALRKCGAHLLHEPTVPAGGLRAIRDETFDVDELAAKGYGHERLDQLVIELLLGVR